MGNSKTSWKGFIYFLAFIATISIAIALVVARIFPQISGALVLVAELVAYSITATLAFNFARRKGYWVYFVIWVIAVVLIIAFKFIKQQ